MGSIRFRFDKGRIKETFGDVVATIRREFPEGAPNHSIHRPPPKARRRVMLGRVCERWRACCSPSRSRHGWPGALHDVPEPTMGRLQTVCDDGTASLDLEPDAGRWDTTVTPPPGQTCTGT